MPSNQLSPDVGNNANFFDDGYTIGSPYWMTEVGAFEDSASAYGTFDQGGNVSEWHETAVTDMSRGSRGGDWRILSSALLAAHRPTSNPTGEFNTLGFRVASVPEPGSITLMLCGAVASLLFWKRRK